MPDGGTIMVTPTGRKFAFDEEELKQLACLVHSAVAASDFIYNSDGDLFQIAFCPDCAKADPNNLKVVIPAAMRAALTKVSS
jgi:hypothetical protein